MLSFRMGLKLYCLNWRQSKTMRKCQRPLNSLSRNAGPYAGQGILERACSLQRQGSGRMSGTTCLSSGSHLRPNTSYCPWLWDQTLRRSFRGRRRCLSGSREKLDQEFLVTPVLRHHRPGCARTDCTVIKCPRRVPYPWDHLELDCSGNRMWWW